MITIIIFVVLGIAFAIFLAVKNKWIIFESAFVGLLLGFFVGLIFATIAGVFIEKAPQIIETEKIYAIEDDSNINGSFFLGIGSVKEKQYYFYYKQMDDGGFMQDKILVDDVIIYEEDNCKSPRIETHICLLKKAGTFGLYLVLGKTKKYLSPKVL